MISADNLTTDSRPPTYTLLFLLEFSDKSAANLEVAPRVPTTWRVVRKGPIREASPEKRRIEKP
jgi:hypothetical protein